MADLGIKESSMAVQVVGGDEQFSAEVDSSGAFKSLIAGKYAGATIPVLVDNEGRIITSGNVSVSSLPGLAQFLRKNIAPGAVEYQTYTVPVQSAIKEFHIGGRVGCEGSIAKYDSTAVDLFGTFNSSGQVSSWTNTGIGDSTLTSWSYSTAQFTEGSGSALFTFTKSDLNNYPEISYTFPTALDLSEWRFISGQVRVSVAAGGNQTRTVSIRLHSGTATRVYSLSGTTTTAPFSTEQWLTINQDVNAPSSTAGTGTFDLNNVTGISLRLTDGGNKAGTIYWDNIKFTGNIDIENKLYSADGQSVQLIFDPVLVFEANEVLMLILRNNNSVTAEMQIAASGVEL